MLESLLAYTYLNAEIVKIEKQRKNRSINNTIMAIDKIRTDLAVLLDDDSLFIETNLLARNEAIACIKYAGDVLKVPGFSSDFEPLYEQALIFRDKLISTNESLFEQVREDLQYGNFTPQDLRAFFDNFTDYIPDKKGFSEFEYDGLDILLNQVFFPTRAPRESQKRVSGMIRYEATPARVILEIIDNLHFTNDDIFYDIGSGLGLVVMLVNLLTSNHSVGIEFDPVYCEYARSCAGILNLKDVTFIQTDARNAQFNTGSIFYLFTPFVNEIFDSVLERLRYTAMRKQIFICSYGTITYDLIKLPWLRIRDPAMEHDFKLAIFTNN